ncbi:MAG: hypothetical protein VX519_04625 [Myxococcota bacterium]|nr:hypothetical protein [Myxococcota bacterium]
MQDRASTYPVAIGVLIGLLLPTLYLVQLLVQRAPERSQWFGGELKVSLESQLPMTLAIELHENESSSSEKLEVKGSARLRQSAYPWDEVPFEAGLRIVLEPEFFEDSSPTEASAAWSASYTERLVSRDDQLGLPPVPCSGVIESRKSHSLGGQPGDLQNWTQMELAVALSCTSAGPDLIWASGDEQTWSVKGPLSLRNRPL